MSFVLWKKKIELLKLRDRIFTNTHTYTSPVEERDRRGGSRVDACFNRYRILQSCVYTCRLFISHYHNERPSPSVTTTGGRTGAREYSIVGNIECLVRSISSSSSSQSRSHRRRHRRSRSRRNCETTLLPHARTIHQSRPVPFLHARASLFAHH